MKIIALCGSLRANSYSMALLRAARELSPPHVQLRIFEHIGGLPLFNPDIEATAPESVRSLWENVTEADAILIASPEYAHGVTGVIKNALDWLVGHIPFANKPVAVLNPSYQSHHADEALKETLRIMTADLIPNACIRIPVIGSGVDLDQIAVHTEFSAALIATLDNIVDHVQKISGGPNEV